MQVHHPRFGDDLNPTQFDLAGHDVAVGLQTAHTPHGSIDMSFVSPAKHRHALESNDLNHLVAEKNGAQVELRIMAASSAPSPVCEQWLTAVLAHADQWSATSDRVVPAATLLLIDGRQRDMELLRQLRELQPNATIFAVVADYCPASAAQALDAGADDLWHCAMQAPEAWARLMAAVRRRSGEME